MATGSALAPGAPKQVAPVHQPHPHGRGAHQTRLPGPPVDIHLSAVGIDAGCTPHRRRLMLGPNGVDPADRHTAAHESHQVSPYRRPLGKTQLAALHERVDSMSIEHLGPIDVANPRQDPLVHQ